jgi:hypothetical protein
MHFIKYVISISKTFNTSLKFIKKMHKMCFFLFLLSTCTLLSFSLIRARFLFSLRVYLLSWAIIPYNILRQYKIFINYSFRYHY